MPGKSAPSVVTMGQQPILPDHKGYAVSETTRSKTKKTLYKEAAAAALRQQQKDMAALVSKIGEAEEQRDAQQAVADAAKATWEASLADLADKENQILTAYNDALAGGWTEEALDEMGVEKPGKPSTGKTAKSHPKSPKAKKTGTGEAAGTKTPDTDHSGSTTAPVEPDGSQASESTGHDDSTSTSHDHVPEPDSVGV